MRISLAILVNIILVMAISGCAAGHQDFIDYRNNFKVGREISQKIPGKWAGAGDFMRGDYVIVGDGLTLITTSADGNLFYHYFVQEILANTRMEKEWIGKCLIYYVVDPTTYIVKSWGFDEGGNPLACRSFT